MNRLLKFSAMSAVVAVMEISAFGQAPPVVWVRKISDNTYTNSAFGATSVAIDRNGNSFFTGTFGLPTIFVGGQTLTNTGAGSDLFIIKYAPTGDVIWVRQVGGNSSQSTRAIGVDSAGGLILAVSTGSTNVTAGTNSISVTGTLPEVLVKFDAQGNCQWMQSITGSGIVVGFGVGGDSNGNVFASGFFTGTDVTIGTNVLTNSNPSTAADFVAKYDPNGNVLWAKQISLADSNSPVLAVDGSGNCYLFTAFSGVADFGSVALTNLSNSTLALAKYDPDGNVIWARTAGTSPGFFSSFFAAVDAQGNPCVLGTGYPELQGITLPAGGSGYSVFVAKYDGSGNVIWGNRIYGNSDVYSGQIAIDALGNCYAAGRTYAPTVNFGSMVLTNTNPGQLTETHGYAAKYASGGQLLWAKLLITPGVQADGIGGAADAQGNVYVYGAARGTNLFNLDGIVLQTPTNGFDYYYSVKLGGPSLNITPQGTDVVISWPTNATGLNLESATNLVGAWSPVTNAPAVNGQSFVVTNAVAGGERYYRLRNF